MPVPQPRDPEATRSSLNAWLPTQLPEATDLRVESLHVPVGSGFSNETILFTAAWREQGRAVREQLVLRVQPQGHQLFFEGDQRDVLFQARCLKAAAGNHIPVAAVRFEEADPSYLGAPFYVMNRVEGRVPADFPSYNQAGWMTELSPAQRRQLWDNAFDVFTSIHDVDWRRGFDFLDQPQRGETGMDQQMRYLSDWYDWVVGGRRLPVIEDAFEYLRSERPGPAGADGVLWGDCRIGNMIFDGLDVAAVCDWEFASLGPPEIDLGWWLFLDRWNSEGVKVARLEGLPDRDETIAVYEAKSSRPLCDVHYYEVLAGLRFCLVAVRARDQSVEMGLTPPDSTGHVANPVTCLTARLLGLPDPPGWDASLRSYGSWGGLEPVHDGS